ncbi:oral-facial-digital syndrome 1 protein homolog isoform X4, partial [Tachysurus ichikawai]
MSMLKCKNVVGSGILGPTPLVYSLRPDPTNPPNLPTSSSSSQESSPQPEKISIQDLTTLQPDFPDGSEQHQDQQMDETHTHTQQDDVVQPATEKKYEEEEERRMEEEEEVWRWQEERRMKEDRRQRGKEEVLERERRKLERLQQELQEDFHDPEEEKTGGATEITDMRTEVKMVEEAGGEREEAQDDPLHRYMLMVMQGREREREQKKDESGSQSPEPIVMSDPKDDRWVCEW